MKVAAKHGEIKAVTGVIARLRAQLGSDRQAQADKIIRLEAAACRAARAHEHFFEVKMLAPN
ncbi:MAG: hypothetical protein HC910_21820 [Spirulinaceae cyanobacterium SM2_1_0]|nr:hypothetical protein [Spirulinaceae cyanobacterium SM2_1_0]